MTIAQDFHIKIVAVRPQTVSRPLASPRSSADYAIYGMGCVNNKINERRSTVNGVLYS